MGAFDWFWRAMGSGTVRDQKRSIAMVQRAAERARELTSLGDADIAAAARNSLKPAHRTKYAGKDASAEAGARTSTGTAKRPAKQPGKRPGKVEVADEATFLAALAIAAERTVGLKPFDVQLQAVLRLVRGDVIQMATGEGKTLVGAMAATGFALTGQRVHVITVNDYLAGRDAKWMRPLVEFFGLSVGVIGEHLRAGERRAAYACDVVYGPVTEIGFDVLRDKQVLDRSEQLQAAADVALVDEADSVLVDEALVPLVLAGAVPGSAPAGRITQVVRTLAEGEDFTVDAEGRNAFLTDKGAGRVERALGIENLYDDAHVGSTLVQVNLALHARALLHRDVDYIVRDGKIRLVDASRGRVADLQRWPDGIQAAVEAKEGLDVTEGGKILDTMTVQALMGRYPTVCGMTGTAVEATDQLRQFYDLRVSVIERNEELARFDEADRIYATAAEKNRAIVNEIELLHSEGRPVLVGTHDVAESEQLAEVLRERGIEVNVLNAKNDAEEAEVIAQAGDVGRVTVSTQMAGRGTDIKLGGADEAEHDRVVALGGLAVLGTSRHKTARLDNQLRGRAGRQGDPGLSLFFVALDDAVVTAGGAGEKIVAHPDAEGRIEDKRVADFIEHCQRVTEGQLLEIHAQTWKYNQLLAKQREIIDARRARLLDTDQAWQELSERAPARAAELAGGSPEPGAPSGSGGGAGATSASVPGGLPREVLVASARQIMLYHLDEQWSEHLALMDDVRESIHLCAIARETPLDEFHRIAVREFKELAQRGVDKAVETFETVTIDAEGAHLEDVGLVRPSATWTYMVSDNPLSSGNSVISGIGNIFR